MLEIFNKVLNNAKKEKIINKLCAVMEHIKNERKYANKGVKLYEF